jgi:hypothetical protein
MREITLDKVIEIDGKMLPINTQGKGMGCYVEVLKVIDEQLMAMLSYHNKVLMVRVDIHMSPDFIASNNSVMTFYTSKMRKWAQQNYDAKRLGFVWVRELCTSKKVHYHVIIMFDGNKLQDHREITAKSVQIAENFSDKGYDYVPNNLKDCFHMIHRGNKLEYNTAFRHASYLAKERTKDKKHLSAKGKNYSASEIQPNIKRDKKELFTADDKVMTEFNYRPTRKPKKSKTNKYSDILE